MSYEAITVQPASPHIGAEIGNIDLTKPLSNNQVEELHRAFVQYQVIFFRDQKIGSLGLIQSSLFTKGEISAVLAGFGRVEITLGQFDRGDFFLIKCIMNFSNGFHKV